MNHGALEVCHVGRRRCWLQQPGQVRCQSWSVTDEALDSWKRNVLLRELYPGRELMLRRSDASSTVRLTSVF